jgi:hypothetical protein
VTAATTDTAAEPAALHGRKIPRERHTGSDSVNDMTDEDWIAEQVAKAPPLSPSRRNRLALLLASDPSGDKLVTIEPAAHASR